MRPPRLLLLLSLSALSVSVFAQGQSTANAPPTTAAAPAASETKAPEPAATSEAEKNKSPATTAPSTPANDDAAIDGLVNLGAKASAAASSSLAAASKSAAAAAAAASESVNALGIKISIDTNRDTTGGIAPVLGIPPAAKQPFMQTSTLPEGTVFIAVGAGLGLCLLILFLWRALVAWSVNRSVKKAGFAPMQKHPQHLEKEMKSLNSLGKKSGGAGGGPGSFYTAAAPSSLSLSDHYGGGAGAARSQSGLFFSPSAAAGQIASPGTPVSSGISSPGFGGDRRSGYYPAGYYNAPGNRASVASFTRQPRAMGSGYLSGMGGEGVSPPGSPMVRPEAGGSRGTERAVGGGGGRYGDLGGASQSSLSLSLPPQGRAPSAVLEDLFESHKMGGRSPGSEGGRGY